jgi:hypothetical protein
MSNSILLIHPYKHQGQWVFDDERVGLVREPFVSGADEIVDLLVANLPNAAAGFTLLFAATPFPGYQQRFSWRREEFGGNWYFSDAYQKEGWLCPALFKYFEQAPKELYAQAKSAA